MYDPRNLLSKEPVAIAAAVRSVLYVLILMNAVNLTPEQLAGIAIAMEVVLGLFARHNSTPTADPTLKAGTTVSVQDSDDSVLIQPTPPGPVGMDDAQREAYDVGDHV